MTREWIIARIVKTDEAVASGGEVSLRQIPSFPWPVDLTFIW